MPALNLSKHLHSWKPVFGGLLRRFRCSRCHAWHHHTPSQQVKGHA